MAVFIQLCHWLDCIDEKRREGESEEMDGAMDRHGGCRKAATVQTIRTLAGHQHIVVFLAPGQRNRIVTQSASLPAPPESRSLSAPSSPARVSLPIQAVEMRVAGAALQQIARIACPVGQTVHQQKRCCREYVLGVAVCLPLGNGLLKGPVVQLVVRVDAAYARTTSCTMAYVFSPVPSL